MADAIVQTIKIEVDGADQAAAEIKKVGQATEDVQATAAQTAGGTQAFGKGLDEVSQKSGISSREMRALGKVMKEFGAGELASTAVGLVRVGSALGGVGIALFAAAAAFSFIRGKIKEADDQLKATTQTMANLAKIGAEILPQQMWEATAAGAKEVANNIILVADQLERIGKGQKEAISPLTSQDTLGKAFVLNLDAAGIAINDVLADTEKLGKASQQTALEAAKLYEKMSPIEKLNFEKVLKGLGFSESDIKNIEKGSVALKKLQDEAAKFKASPQGQALDAFNAAVVKSLEIVEGWGQTLKIKFAEVVLGWKAIFSGGFGFFGEVLAEAGRLVVEGLVSIGSSIAQAVSAWVTTKAGNAWQWIVDTAVSVWDSVKTLAQQAYQDVVKFVTTAPANAWAWIKETWNANVPKFLQFGDGAGGGGSGGGGAATQSLAGGGLLGGRGSGTSDSNLAWVSRGEHIMPARAVSQPGVLALLEALRFSGGNLRGVLNSMGHFALGGMVAPRLSIPALAGGGMSHVTINFPGLPEITGLRASSTVVDQLRNAAAMAQVRSGGRKPSRYS
jgi:hypothetical protein